MKRQFTTILILALAAGCAKENKPGLPDAGELMLTSWADRPSVTKTAVSGNRTDGFTAEWDEADAIGIYTTAGTANARHAISIQPDGTAKFSGPVKASEDGQTLFAYYPYSDNAGSTPEEALMSIPAAQTMTGDSYDASAAVMVAKPQTAVLSGDTGEIGNWRFAHLGAYFCISVSGDITAGGISAGEILKSVELRAEGKKIAGGMKVNLTDGSFTFVNAEDHVLAAVGGEKKLSEAEVWLVTAPFSLEGEKLSIVFNTENRSISKQAVLSRGFSAGSVYTLGVKLDGDCEVAPYIDVADTGNLMFGINGESRTFAVDSNTDWTVSCDNDAFTAEKGDNATLKVSVKKNTGFSPKKCAVRLKGDGAEKTLEFTQKSLWKKESQGNCTFNGDGSVTITASASSPNPRIIVDNGSVTNKVDFYNMKFRIREASLTKGYLHVNTWGTTEINYQILIGGENKFVTGPAFSSRNVKLSKEFTADDLNGIREAVLAFEPYTPTGGTWNGSVKCVMTVDGTKVLDDWGMNRNPWMPGASSWQNGVDFYFGITGAEGSITIESCDFTAISRSR